MLLPPGLRKPGISAVLYAGMNALGRLHMDFLEFRNDIDYRLAHNGQACYLTALINDFFDPELRRIYILEDDMVNGGSIIYRRSEDNARHTPLRASGRAYIINRRGFGGTSGLDFWICVPSELSTRIDIYRLRAIVKAYRLTSKRFEINYV